MSGINKVTLLGRLGKDPETRYTADGKAITSFSLATSYGKGDAEVTEWHRCVAFDKTGTLTRGEPEVTDIYPLDGTVILQFRADFAVAAEDHVAELTGAGFREA